MAKPLDLIGQRFGRLTVTDRIGMNDKRFVMWQCHCDCGRDIAISTRDLRSRSVVSCGCNRREKSKRNLTTMRAEEKLGQIAGTSLSQLRSTKPPVNNTSGVRGVSMLPSGRYRAYVYFRGKRMDAGTFDHLDDAKKAVDALRKSIIEDVRETPEAQTWFKKHPTRTHRKESKA